MKSVSQKNTSILNCALYVHGRDREKEPLVVIVEFAYLV